jgi:hypothetical protein
MSILNPKHLHLQERPDKYGGKYSQDELDKFIKKAHKKGQTMIYYGSKSLKVKQEMDRINEAKNQKPLFSFFTNPFSKSTKKGSTKKPKSAKKSSAKKSSAKKSSTKKPKSAKNPKQKVLTRRKMTKVKKSNKPVIKGHASLKKKYQKLCNKKCKQDYPIDICMYKDNICEWYDSDYNRDCNVKSFYKEVDKEDLKNGVIIKKYDSKNGCSLGKETKIVRL